MRHLVLRTLRQFNSESDDQPTPGQCRRTLSPGMHRPAAQSRVRSARSVVEVHVGASDSRLKLDATMRPCQLERRQNAPFVGNLEVGPQSTLRSLGRNMPERVYSVGRFGDNSNPGGTSGGRVWINSWFSTLRTEAWVRPAVHSNRLTGGWGNGQHDAGISVDEQNRVALLDHHKVGVDHLAAGTERSLPGWRQPPQPTEAPVRS